MIYILLFFLLCEARAITITEPAQEETTIYTVSGGRAELPCNIDTPPNQLEVFWVFDSTPIFRVSNGQETDYSNLIRRRFSNPISVASTDFSIQLNPVNVEDLGTYSCSLLGSAVPLKRTIHLKEAELQVAVSIAQPTVLINQQVTLTCSASGEPRNWQFFWSLSPTYAEEDELDLTASASIVNDSISQLVIQSSAVENNGVYSCNVSNSVITATASSGRVTVEFAPREAPTFLNRPKVVRLQRGKGGSTDTIFTVPYISEPAADRVVWRYLGVDRTLDAELPSGSTPCPEPGLAKLCIGFIDDNSYGVYNVNISNKQGSFSVAVELTSQSGGGSTGASQDSGPNAALIGGVVGGFVFLILVVVVLVVLWKRGLFKRTKDDSVSKSSSREKDRRTPEERQFSDIVHKTTHNQENPMENDSGRTSQQSMRPARQAENNAPSTGVPRGDRGYTNTSLDMAADPDSAKTDYPRYVPRPSGGGQVNLGLDGEGSPPAYSPSERSANSYGSSPPQHSPPPSPGSPEYIYSKTHADWKENKAGLHYEDVRLPRTPSTPTEGPRIYRRPSNDDPPSVYANVNFSPTTV